MSFFVLPKSADAKYKKLYTAVVNHVDLPKNETLRSCVFLSQIRWCEVGKKPNPRMRWLTWKFTLGN